jgi:histidinol phosphatase-like PHP family hydrolase
VIEDDGLADRLQDLHVHTTMSDGDVSLEHVAVLARELGVHVGVADHVSTRNTERFVADVPSVARYLDALDGAPVMRSAEFCWCDSLWRDLPIELMRRFDYRIGSNHGFWLPDGSMASPWWQTLPSPWNEQPDELMDLLVHNLCDLVRTMPIELVAHATLLPPALLEREPDPEYWWTEAREDRFIESVVESGVAIEISTRYRLPHVRLLRKAREAGARFSLGSDAHLARQVGVLDWSIAQARRAGIEAKHLLRIDAPDGRS